MSKLGEIQNISSSFLTDKVKNLSNIEKLGGIEYEKMDFMYDFVSCWFKY